jgi:hypothetical protein
MVLGHHGTLEASVQHLYKLRSALGGVGIARGKALKSSRYELGLCQTAFHAEIDVFSQARGLVDSGLSPEDAWKQLQEALVPLSSRAKPDHPGHP